MSKILQKTMTVIMHMLKASDVFIFGDVQSNVAS